MKLKILYWLIAGIVLLVIASAIYYGLTPAPYKPQGFDVPHEANEIPKLIANKGKLSPTDVGNSLPTIKKFLASPIEGIRLDVGRDARGKLIINSKDALPLEEVLKFIGTQKFIFLHVDNYKLFNRQLAQDLNALIDKYNLADTVIVESLNPIFLWQYRRIAPYKLIMYDFTTYRTEGGISSEQVRLPMIFKRSVVQEWARWILHPDILGPRANIAVGKILLFVKLGYPVVVRSVNDVKQAEEFFKLGASSLITSNALQLQAVVPITGNLVDASNVEIGVNEQIITVRTIDDIFHAIQQATSTGKKISIYGRRHSQGGQALGDNTIALNMKPLHNIYLQKDGSTVTVQAGATWEQVQIYLNTFGLAVKVMQSENIFTVGGSASVNAFGWQVSSPPFASTVKKMKIVLANGKLVECSRTKNPELFQAALGGYGLLGVITELDLETVPNYALKNTQIMTSINEFVNQYALNVTLQPKAELAYGRLEVDTDHQFYDMLLVIYARDKSGTIIKEKLDPHLQVQLKNLIFAAAQRNEESRKTRWSLERNSYETIAEEFGSRNQLMSADVQTLWPYNERYTDILQTYFLPKSEIPVLFKSLRNLLTEFELNLLMCTITEVRKDDITVLAYAKQDMFAITLMFSQENTVVADVRLAEFTEKLTEITLSQGGSFYLPYRPHYTKQQFVTAYPNLDKFLQIKQKYDPTTLFINKWYLRYMTD